MSDKEEEDVEPIPDTITTLDQVHASSVNRVLSLQTAMKDKKVVISGPEDTPYTVEAWEQERKIRTYQQLKLARKLRCIMENAVEEARKSGGAPMVAKDIFFERREDMLELASLTSAVVGGYTLHSYRDFVGKEQEKEQKDNRCFEQSQQYLHDLRERIFWEHSPEAFLQEFNKNRSVRRVKPTSGRNPVGSSCFKLRTEKTSRNLLLGANIGEKKDYDVNKQHNINTRRNVVISKNNSPEKKSPEKKQITHHSPVKTKVASPSAQLKHVKQSTAKNGDHQEYEKANNIDAPNNSPKYPLIVTSPPSHNISSEHSLHIESTTKAAKSSPKLSSTSKVASSSNAITKKDKPKSKRKCHYCKDLSINYAICKYWFINGNKCKKIFCYKCLDHFKVEPSDEEDWHCPSCTGKCDCRVCVKDREREEQRKTKRRRTTRFDFSIFS